MFLSFYLSLKQFQKLVLSLLMNTAFQHLSVKQLRLKHSTFEIIAEKPCTLQNCYLESA